MMNETTSRPTQRLPMTGARRLRWVLGVPVVLALAGSAGLTAVGLLSTGSFPVSYAFPPGNGRLAAHLEGSTITLRQAATGNTPALTGTAHYTLLKSTFTHSGGTVRYHCPWGLGTCSLNATLRVPASSAVSLATHGGDVKLPDFSQNITLNTGGGDLTAGTVNGGLNFTTGGGDLTAGRLSGDLNLSTSGGDVNVGRLTAPSAKLATGGGDVTVNALAASGAATVLSSGGDVTVTCTSAPANLRVTSGGGDVTIVLPEGSYAFHTNTGGGDLSQPASNPHAHNEVTVQSGGGDVTIHEAS